MTACELWAEEDRGHALSHVCVHSLRLSSHTHLLKGQNLAVSLVNYSTNCCPACRRPVCIMSQHSSDGTDSLIMQFLQSARLAHASCNLCAAAADQGNCGNNCLSLLVGSADIWRIPSRGLTELFEVPVVMLALHAISHVRRMPRATRCQSGSWRVGGG